MGLGGKKCLQLARFLLHCLLPGCVPCVFRVVGCSSSLLWPRRGRGRLHSLEVGGRNLPAKCLPAQGVDTRIPGQRGQSLTVLFISVMQEMHRGHVPPVPHIKGESKDTEVLLTALLYSAMYM